MYDLKICDSSDGRKVSDALSGQFPDMIYSDTLFGTGQTRSVGSGETYDDTKSTAHAFTEKMIQSAFDNLSDDGTFWLHCDPHSNFLYREMLNDIFGSANYLNEVIWAYSSGGAPTRKMPSKHDTIFWYARDAKSNYTYNIIREPYRSLKKDEVRKGFHKDGKAISSCWSDIGIISTTGKERVDWPTQKPKKLLNRIIKISTNEGDLVADLCCGSATTVEAAVEMGRKAIGLDISPVAIAKGKQRMLDFEARQLAGVS